MNQKLLYKTIAAYLIAIIVWSLLFLNNQYLKSVLFDIHLIFSSTIICYILMRMFFSSTTIDFIKVFIRILFRVWLFIFITYAITNSMDRIGILLSLSFIFGYIEGLIDINKWLELNPTFLNLLPKEIGINKSNQTSATIFLMSLIHILCALAVLVFYIAFNDKQYFYEPYESIKQMLSGG